MAWFAVIIVASALRLAGMFNEFWLDEIWSWEIAGQIADPVEIIYYREDDNNHWLNTFWIYALGQEQPLFVYRTLSLAARHRLGYRRRVHWPNLWLAAGVVVAASHRHVLHADPLLVGSTRLCSSRVFRPCLRLAHAAAGEAPRWAAACCSAVVRLWISCHLTFLFIYAGLALWSLTVFCARFGLARTSLTHWFSCTFTVGHVCFLYYANVATFTGKRRSAIH